MKGHKCRFIGHFPKLFTFMIDKKFQKISFFSNKKSFIFGAVQYKWRYCMTEAIKNRKKDKTC